MDRATFESTDPILDEIAAKLDELLDSDQFATFRTLLARLSEAAGPRYSVDLKVGVEVFDLERRRAPPSVDHGFFDLQR